MGCVHITNSKQRKHHAFVKIAMDYKIAGERELEHRERLGITDAPSVMTSLPMSKAR